LPSLTCHATTAPPVGFLCPTAFFNSPGNLCFPTRFECTESRQSHFTLAPPLAKPKNPPCYNPYLRTRDTQAVSKLSGVSSIASCPALWFLLSATHPWPRWFRDRSRSFLRPDTEALTTFTHPSRLRSKLRNDSQPPPRSIPIFRGQDGL